VAKGGTITLTVANGPGNRYDWVGLYCPTTVDDEDYDENRWKYLSNSQTAPSSGQTGAVITFTAPTTAGTCNARFFADDGFTKLATSQVITVGGPSISAGSTTVARGGTMTFTVAGGPANPKDWVGLYCPSTIGDSTNYTNYKYLNNSQSAPSSGQTGGTITFTAPTTSTTCQARLFPNDSYTPTLATSQTVTVQ
jgi:hypothetical protein